MRTVETRPRIQYALSNAAADVPLVELVRARFTRHRVEEVLEAAKQEAGLAHYEVRSWVGWHHHMTLSVLALWFLCGEQRRGGGKRPRSPFRRSGRCSRDCCGRRPRARSGSARR
jgi:SRSO17 transposase